MINNIGQSAIEFLMTYGWAILLIVIVISAFTYFGVLSPSRLLPNRCSFGPEISCEEFSFQAPATVKFRFKNNLGTSADFDISLESVDGYGQDGTCGGPFTIGAGKVQEAVCTLVPGGFPSDEKIKMLVYMNYTKLGGSYKTPVYGEIYGASR